MAKFKKGDRVRNTLPDLYVKVHATGVVIEGDDVPVIKWDSDDMLTDHGRRCELFNAHGWVAMNEDGLELITEPSVATPETGPAPGTLEHWRWTMAAQAMHGICAHPDTWGNAIDGIAKKSVQMADYLIAELKGGKP